MAEDAESAVMETKKVINPRVEIDTSPPFESVKEAVDRFGGGGPWLPHHLLRLAADQHETEVFDIGKMEEQTAQLERDLIMKEQETLHVLKELEAAKRFVESLKVNLVQEVSVFMASPELKAEVYNAAGGLTLCPSMSPGLISMELNQAKMNLSKTTTNLALIRASVESLNKKMKAEKILLEKSKDRRIPNFSAVMPVEESKDYHECRATPDKDHFVPATVNTESSMNTSKELLELNFEAEQFKKMTEASRYEVMKAMAEIERTKTSIKMAEMRLTAARKMEEAAKAVEAIALAERDCQVDCKNSPEMFFHKSEGITLSFEEYTALTHKAQQAEELCKTKFIDSIAMYHTDQRNQSEAALVKKLETTTTKTKETKRTKNSLEQALDKEDRLDRRNVGFNDDSCQETPEHDQMENLAQKADKFRFRNSHPSAHRRSQPLNGNESNEIKDKSVPVYRSTISIGDILSRKLILQDDMVVGKHVENHGERQEVSLSQMLREQSGLIMNPTKSTKDGSADKQYYAAQRKKFGFIHVTIPRQIKKKTQILNPR